LEPFSCHIDEAVTVEEHILRRLGELIVNDTKHRKWHSLYQAVESLWSENEIARLLKRLSSLKEAPETQVLFSIR